MNFENRTKDETAELDEIVSKYGSGGDNKTSEIGEDLGKITEKVTLSKETEKSNEIQEKNQDQYENYEIRGNKSFGERILSRQGTFVISATVIVLCLIVNTVASVLAEPPIELPEFNSRVLTIGGGRLPELEPLPVPIPTPRWTEHNGYSIERNGDLIGWIEIEDTRLNYPVVQKTLEQYEESGYNGFYWINRNFDGVWIYESRGTLFVDRHTPIADTRRPNNTVIYGHNMRFGHKFNFLIDYVNSFYYTYQKHPTIQFVTIYDEFDSVYNTYKIFAGIHQNTRQAHGQVFDYFRRRHFNSDHWEHWGGTAQDAFFDFIGNVMDRSLFFTDVDVQFGDEILTLSTCLFEPLGRDVDARFAIFARRLRPGEDPHVNTDVARQNPDPLMFDEWYRRRGGSWGGERMWDTSKVLGFDEWLANNPNWCSTDPQRAS